VKSATLYRIAAVVMVLFAAGHTYGFLTLQPPTPEALAVRQGMMNVHFRIDNGDFSYGGFYTGFGLSITAYMLFCAFLAWHLAKHPDRAIGWALFAVQASGLPLSWMYFPIAPTVFSAALAVLLGVAAWRQPVTRS
jgi:hypothetical protein